jgi:hypothetical protein
MSEQVQLGEIGKDKTRPIMPGDHTLAVMNEKGDTKTVWNANNDVEVENARETFKRFKKKGYMIYKVSGDGKKGEVMNEFDPNAQKMIAAPNLQGG